MLPTVGGLLGLDVVRRGSPQVIAGSGGLGARTSLHVAVLVLSGQASKTWPTRSMTGPSQLHGKLIQRSVRFQT
jgi:hypothetical protein